MPGLDLPQVELAECRRLQPAKRVPAGQLCNPCQPPSGRGLGSPGVGTAEDEMLTGRGPSRSVPDPGRSLPAALLRCRASTRDSGPAVSAAARGTETPDTRAFLGKEEGVSPSPALCTAPALSGAEWLPRGL